MFMRSGWRVTTTGKMNLYNSLLPFFAGFWQMIAKTSEFKLKSLSTFFVFRPINYSVITDDFLTKRSHVVAQNVYQFLTPYIGNAVEDSN
jgi:hypothetical protein